MTSSQNDDGETREEPVLVYSAGFFPYGFLKEAKALWHLAWPLSLSILFHYLIQPISLAFCGHLGQRELAAVAIALSVIYVTTVSFGRGLAFGGDTYFSQTYGSANKKMMGIYLQRGLLFGFLLSFPIWAILLNTETLLLLIGQDFMVAKLAQDYCLVFMPGVPAYCWLFLLMRYLLCQNRVLPNFFICVFACAVNAGMHYILLYVVQMGIIGSAISLVCSYYLVLILFIAYIIISGIYHETWPGWSWESLTDWGPFGRTALASMAMTFIFWLCTEAGTYLAGVLGEKQISAYSIMFQVEGFVWMVPLGLGGACGARVGQFLGSNEPLGAMTTTRVTFCIVVVISLIMAIATYALKDYIPMAFTSDRDIIEYTANLNQILAIFVLLEGFGGCGVGILRGTGRQVMGLVIILVAYYVVALPIGIPVMYLTSLGLAGLWWAYTLGIGLQDLLLTCIILKMDWNNEARQAQIRAGVIEKDKEYTVRSDEEVDEHTSLLGNRNVNNEEDNKTLNNNIVWTSESRRPSGSVLLQRFGLLLVCVLILGLGVLARYTVKLSIPQSTLCIPVDNSTITADLPVLTNQSLPFCNETMLYI